MYSAKPHDSEILVDGTVVARAGTQTNSGGIAKVHAKITANPGGVLTVGPEFDNTWTDDRYGATVPGRAIPEAYRHAAFNGAQSAFDRCSAGVGVHFELIDALVHAIDARASKFNQAAFLAMKGWLDVYFPGSWKDASEE